MKNSFEDAKARIDCDMDDAKRHSTVPSMLGDNEKKKRWSDSKEPDQEKSINVEIPQNDPPPAVFTSYPPSRSRRWGLFVPAWLIALFILVLMFESSILFIYTIVGLYKETAPVILSAASAAGMSGSCDCASFGTHAGVSAAPNVEGPSISIITVTDTPATQPAEPPIRPTSIETSVSTESSVSTTTASGTTTTASASTSLLTTTATPPVSTTITTITPTEPPATSTTFSTSTIPNTPAPDHTIFSTETVAPSSSGKHPAPKSAG
ncbi:MAG: hypothetical protein Q9165_006481 [Trypethelium subeluteriae]